MFRFNLLLLTTLLLCSPAYADDHLVNFSYWNWGEAFQMKKDDLVQDSNSNFSALGLEYEYSSGLKSRGWNAAAALLLGQATGGDANGNIIYIASYQRFFGAAAKVNWFWRVERRVYLEAGPLLLFRSFQWPSSADGISADSGSTVNFGASLNLRIRMNRRLDFCQSLGTLLSKGGTMWSAGLGYRF